MDAMRKDNSYYIIPNHLAKTDGIKDIMNGDVAIFIYLYYLDTLEKYMVYVNKIPENISVYLITSNHQVMKSLESYIHNNVKYKNIILIEKENRGRDVSALLVACRKYILQYKIICFIHDKKCISDYLKEDTDNWIENLWGNTINCTGYIVNLLNLFRIHKELGLLVPPAPLGRYMTAWFDNNWHGNHENVKKVAKKIGLNCEINRETGPITLGTVFWCKTKALKKLFDLKWEYEDFDEEPLPYNGTVSHAIERILSFVAEDAGYKTGIVMNTAYAEGFLSRLQRNTIDMFKILSEYVGVSNIYEIQNFNNRKKQIVDFFDDNRKVFMFGAGKKAISCLRALKILGHQPKKIIVTKKCIENQELQGIPVAEFDEVDNFNSVGIIIAVGNKFAREVVDFLESRDFHNYIFFLSDIE